MIYLHQLVALIGGWAVSFTSFLGYPGIFVLMALESMVVPLPSEMIMPFAGFLVATGRFGFWLVVLASSLGSLFGSLLSYAMGYWGGEKFVRHWGRYVFLDETDLARTESWFRKKGEVTIFIARFVPVVRHLISIPAGIGKMDLKKFCLYTVLGATPWNTFLLWLGFILGQNWQLVRKYSEFISLPLFIIICLAIAILAFRHINNKRRLLAKHQ